MAILEAQTKCVDNPPHNRLQTETELAFEFKKLAGRTEVVNLIKSLQYPVSASTEADPAPYQSPQLTAIQREMEKINSLKKQ